MPKKDPNIETLRSAIAACDSRYKLAGEADVDQSVISRFMAGTDIRLEVAARLMSALGLEVRRKK